MSLNPSSSPAPSFFHHQAATMFPKFLDGSFNGNSTSTNFSGGNTVRPKVGGFASTPTPTPTQPSAKMLDNWFNGNKTSVNVCPKAMNNGGFGGSNLMPM